MIQSRRILQYFVENMCYDSNPLSFEDAFADIKELY